MNRIIPFTQQYLTGVTEMILCIQKTEFGIAISLEDQPDLLDIATFYQRGRGNFWVALEGDQVIGTVGLWDIAKDAGALRKMLSAPIDAARNTTAHADYWRLYSSGVIWVIYAKCIWARPISSSLPIDFMRRTASETLCAVNCHAHFQ